MINQDLKTDGKFAERILILARSVKSAREPVLKVLVSLQADWDETVVPSPPTGGDGKLGLRNGHGRGVPDGDAR